MIYLIAAILVVEVYNLIQIRKVVKYMKQVKINEDTFDALLALAERGAQALSDDATDKATIAAGAQEIANLKAANENEEDLTGDRAARVEALINSAPAVAPANPSATTVPAEQPVQTEPAAVEPAASGESTPPTEQPAETSSPS